MSVKIETSKIIERPIEEVFSLLLDLRNSKAFDPDVKTVEKTTDGPIAVGTEFRFYERTPPFGRFQYTSVQYTGIRPNECIDFTAQVGPLFPTGSFIFTKVDGGTRITFSGDPNPSGFLKLLSPMVVQQGRKTWEKRLEYIKAWMEKRNL